MEEEAGKVAFQNKGNQLSSKSMWKKIRNNVYVNTGRLSSSNTANISNCSGDGLSYGGFFFFWNIS